MHTILISLLVLFSQSSSDRQLEELLLGGWQCVEGVCPDEEISFDLEDGARVYRSWLHHRPGVSNGHWTLEAKILSIAYLDSVEKWRIAKVTKEKLILHDISTGEAALFKKINPSTGLSDLGKRVEAFLDNFKAEYSIQGYAESPLGYSSPHESIVEDHMLLLKKNTAFINHYKQRVYQRLHLTAIRYRSIEKRNECFNAMESAKGPMGLLGDEKLIQTGANNATFPSPPFISIIQGDEAILLEIDCEHVNEDWQRIKSTFLKAFLDQKDATAFWIECGCGGPLTLTRNQSSHSKSQ